MLSQISNQNSPITSVIPDSKARDLFFSNKDLFSIDIEYKPNFQIITGEKITAHSYKNINLEMSNLKSIINTLIANDVNWALELRHNLLSSILLVRKDIEVFLKKTG